MYIFAFQSHLKLLGFPRVVMQSEPLSVMRARNKQTGHVTMSGADVTSITCKTVEFNYLSSPNVNGA